MHANPVAERGLKTLRVSSAPTVQAAPTTVYKRFFIAGIISVLTAGCTLGAAALWGIAGNGNYATTQWTPYVLAHANSQLYGWVGFFIIGFALQQHAPKPSKARLFEGLAWTTLILMALGMGLRFAAEPLVHVSPAVWMPIGIFSTLLQFSAVCLFLLNTAATRQPTGEKMSWQTGLVFCSLFWLFAVSMAEPFYFALAHQASETGAIMFVAKWFPPYRDAQFLGFVTMMIFGVALVKMNSCFGAKEPSKQLGQLGFLVWNIGLIARMVGWVVYANAGFERSSQFLYVFGGLALAAGAVLLVLASRMFERLREPLTSQKFVRTAFAWLLISGVLMILEPFHLNAIGMPFSHAYIGAIRHALTVGFISQMILGVGLHVVYRMRDIPVAQEPSLWAAFVLVNLGNSMRVFLQIATDYYPGAFHAMGFSGFIELIGLGFWAWAVLPKLVSRRLGAASHA